MSDRTSRLARLAADLTPAIIDLRRDLHRNPEVGWTEYRTTRRVAEVLADQGLSPQVRPDGTGLTVEIGSGDPIVGFRADMDALPIQEEADPEYRSERDLSLIHISEPTRPTT